MTRIKEEPIKVRTRSVPSPRSSRHDGASAIEVAALVSVVEVGLTIAGTPHRPVMVPYIEVLPRREHLACVGQVPEILELGTLMKLRRNIKTLVH